MKRHLSLLLMLTASISAPSGAFAQTKIANTAINGNTTINPGSAYTRIFVFNPPQSDIGTAANHTNFVNTVITQDAIDGVTVAVAWNTVETTAPSATPCANVGTDTCQQDSNATPYYHTYDWSSVNGGDCTDQSPGSISQWFCFRYSSGAYKKVNIILYGIGSPGQQLMPNYVTSSTWLNETVAAQDVVNTINSPSTPPVSCSANYSGPNVPAGTTWSGDNMNPTTVTVTGWSNPPLQVGDTIWVKGGTGFPPSLNVTGQTGQLITSVTPSGTMAGFTYLATTVTNASTTTISSTPTVSALESWPVPYETPYKTAWLAFLKAAIYHFNHLSNSSNPHETVGQIGYIRPGVARRGEATPLCTNQLISFNTNPTYTEQHWLDWYTQVNNTVQSANPQMQIIFAIDAGDPQSRDATYATAEAGIAAGTSDAVGMNNGFGSEGLEQTDITTYSISGCPGAAMTAPNTSENWGCMFATYWSGATGSIGSMTAVPTTVPLELQQADCSNPASVASSSGNCFIPVSGNTGLTLDLRPLYQFAIDQHATVLELYYQDALLAYDPNYCKISVGTCVSATNYDWFPSDFTPAVQYGSYCSVGQNTVQGVTGCTGCTGGPCYADKLNSVHGYH